LGHVSIPRWESGSADRKPSRGVSVTSDAANMIYERDGNRRAASDRAFAAYDDHLASVDRTKNTK